MRTPAPRTRALAGKLRPFVAELAGTARPTGGHAGDDRVARAGQAIRLGSAPRSYQRIAGARLHGCGRGTASGHGGGTPPPAHRNTRGERARKLRPPASPHAGVRPSTPPP